MRTNCKHDDNNYHWKHVQCKVCGQVYTDSGDDWGIAKNKTFNSLDEAEFYKTNGKLPETNNA